MVDYGGIVGKKNGIAIRRNGMGYMIEDGGDWLKVFVGRRGCDSFSIHCGSSFYRVVYGPMEQHRLCSFNH